MNPGKVFRHFETISRSLIRSANKNFSHKNSGTSRIARKYEGQNEKFFIKADSLN